jgi:putative endonuclease
VDGSIYTGVTVDVAMRYAAHVNGKGARYTRSHPPSRLMSVVEYPDRSSALKAEHSVKQLSAREKRALAAPGAAHDVRTNDSKRNKTQDTAEVVRGTRNPAHRGHR